MQELDHTPPVDVLVVECGKFTAERLDRVFSRLAHGGERPLVLRLGILAEAVHPLYGFLEQRLERWGLHTFEQR